MQMWLYIPAALALVLHSPSPAIGMNDKYEKLEEKSGATVRASVQNPNSRTIASSSTQKSNDYLNQHQSNASPMRIFTKSTMEDEKSSTENNAAKKKKKRKKIKKSLLTSVKGKENNEAPAPSFLKAKDLYLMEFLEEKIKNGINSLLEQGVELRLEKKEKEASLIFEKAARLGAHEAMYYLGEYYNNKNDLDEANRWYFLAFQRYWEATGKVCANYHKILINYKGQGSTPHKDLEKIFHTFNPKSSTAEEMFKFYNAICIAYQNETLEPYLSKEERTLKITHILNLIAGITPSEKAKDLDIYYQRLNRLACIYLKEILPQDFNKITDLFERSIKLPESKYNLGLLYLEGKAGEKLSKNERYKKAEELLKTSQNPDAQYKLGIMYWDGEMGWDLMEEARYEKAREYFEASDTENSHYNLGLMYKKALIGSTLSQNEKESKAKNYFAASNIPEAKFRLGLMYLHQQAGKDLGEEKCIQEAKRLLEESNIPNAQYNLGNIYLKEAMVKYQLSNKSEDELFNKAAKLFEKSNTSEALCDLGYIYANGFIELQLSEEDRIKKAIEFYKKSKEEAAKKSLVILYVQKLFNNQESPNEELIPSLIKIFDEIGEPALYHYGRAFLIAFFPEYMEEFSSDMERYEEALKLAEEAQEEGVREAGELIAEIKKMREEEISEGMEESIEADDFNKQKANQLEEMHPTKLLAQQKTEELSKKAPLQAHALKESKRVKKPQKQEEEVRRKKRFERFKETFFQMKATPLSLVNNHPLSFDFISDRVNQDFKKFRQNNRKFRELLNDILEKPWGTEGVGRPEKLRGDLEGYYSRRINGEDRLVYKYLPSQNKIIVRQCGQHY